MKTPPKLPHVKHVTTKGIRYGYFDSGRKRDGKPVYVPLGRIGSAGYYDRYASALAGRNRTPGQIYTVEKLCDDFRNSREFDKFKAGTRRGYAVYLKLIVELFGPSPIDDLKRADIQLVLDNEDWGGGKANLFVATIGAAYKWARGKNRTDAQPTRGIASAETGERIKWPDDLLEAGLHAEDDTVRLAVALLFYTGQRIGDVCAMRWSDMKTGPLKIVQQKTDKPLTIPLHSALKAELDRYGKRGVTLLTNAIGKPLSPARLRDYYLKPFVAAQGHAGLLPHGLRKNAVIALLEAGCSVAETAAITGQTYELVEYYARQIDQAKMAGAAILKLEQAGNRKTVGKTGPETRRKP